ncbi:uncharacterized protein LOC130710607 isoform X2 [Lotus japonicus]|uniref:uncharacterized protein LOC130710607 isoform X2 n=1 Tax=Lotus japonicus TaxID=34305 RepID=UPI002590B48C|nr:uncharacterized protein LOC130710607 isoform X2 [Lotus japonicus]
MPFVTTETTKTVAEHIKWRRPRDQFRHHHHHHHHPISETDPNPQIQSTRCKSTISALLLSTFSNETTTTTPQAATSARSRKKSNFSAAAFRGLGCTAGASQQVSVPAAIRASADWQGKKGRKKKHKRNSSNKNCHGGMVDGSSATCVDFQDVWCGPGIGFSGDAVAASVDCVVSRKNVSARGKIDVEKIAQRERSYSCRHSVVTFPDSADENVFTPPFEEPETYYVRDSEQLLELSERIGYVSTGLKEEEMRKNIRKLQISDDASQVDKNCTICQEEYEVEEEIGRLNCGHSYHYQCIQQWVEQKNFCPVCKRLVAARH